MRVFLEDIYWHVREGHDVTELPTEAVIELDGEDIMDSDEFFEAAEDVLESRHNVRVNGFRYTILDGTVH